MPITTRGELRGPTGKRKNCETWAEYEPSGKSEFANLCNGGWFDGDYWEPCSSRLDCRKATYLGRSRSRTESDSRRHLPVRQSSNRVSFEPRTSHPRRPKIDQVKVYVPEDEQPYLDTPRIEHQGMGGQMSPTFLPGEDEGLLVRLAKNMGQGAINAVFWHGYDLSRTVDFFPRRKRRRRRHEEDDD